MVHPPYLKIGDTIGIVAPASFITEDEIRSGTDLISSWGLRILQGKNLFRKWNSFAGSDGERLSDFQEMLDNPEVKAILCARGGYGAIRIVDKLNVANLVKNPKWIIGCSDITVLHAVVHQLAGIESLHAAMPRNVTSGKKDLASFQTLKDALFGKLGEYRIPPHTHNREGNSSGILIGGNLSVLYSMRGTSFDIDTKDKILFIEDLHEYLYHIDRIVTNLVLGHKLEGLKGLIIGGMNNMKKSASGFNKPAYEIIRDAVRPYQYPVMFGMPAGHIKPNKTLIFGRHVRIEVGNTQCKLIF